MKAKVMIALNTTWNLYNFRAGLIRALAAEGYEVVAVAPRDEYTPRLSGLGCRFAPLYMDNGGTNPILDLLLLARFFWLLRRERPQVLLGYTAKPNIYGSLAANALGIPVINNIAGLGAVFIRPSLLTRLVRWMYRIALARSRCVFFQNNDDLQMFVRSGLVSPEKAARLPGSGIDLRRFHPVPAAPLTGRPFRFLLVARMLRDKGVIEYVEAARTVRYAFPEVEFHLLGFVDVKNPTAISNDKLAAWVNEGVVCFAGATDDVRPYLAAADCVVLPSYSEGTPRSLLEAAAMAKPIITTDAVGCRDVVDDGVNGFLCKVRDAADLAEKMKRMIRLSDEARAEMGVLGRKKMEREFDEQIVINRYLAVVNKLAMTSHRNTQDLT